MHHQARGLAGTHELAAFNFSKLLLFTVVLVGLEGLSCSIAQWDKPQHMVNSLVMCIVSCCEIPFLFSCVEFCVILCNGNYD